MPEFNIVRRRREPSGTAQDRYSKGLIAVGQGLATFLAFAAAIFVPAAALPHREWCFWAGVGTMVIGSLLRRHCWRMLGASFTGAVIVKPEQTIVERGLYRYVRHPSYTAGAIVFAGEGLALGNWIGLTVLLAAVCAVYGYRVRVEERALVTVLGDGYRRYMNRTTRFVPLLF